MKNSVYALKDFVTHELDVLDDDALVLLILLALLLEDEELVAELLVHDQDLATDDGHELLVLRLLHGDDLTGLSGLGLDQLDGELLVLLIGF